MFFSYLVLYGICRLLTVTVQYYPRGITNNGNHPAGSRGQNPS